MYTVVLVSGVQQSDSVVHVYRFLFILSPTVVYHRILNVDPSAVQSALVVGPSYL